MTRPTLVYDCETDGLLDTVSEIHCIVVKHADRPVAWVYVAPENLGRAQQWVSASVTGVKVFCYPLEKFDLGQGNRIVCHNQIGYDLRVFRKLLGYDAAPGNEVVDSLVLSRYLNSDRPAHGLEWWGRQLGTPKVPVADWTTDDIELYLARCFQDVLINERMFFQLWAEYEADHLLAPGLELAHQTYEAMTQQELDGVVLDQPAARALLDQLSHEMAEIEADVEPKLGEAPLPKSKQPTYPAKPFKKDGSLTKSALAYGAKIGVRDPDELTLMLKANIRQTLTAPVKLANTEAIKLFLYKEMGWRPTIWRTKDITQKEKRPTSRKELTSQVRKYAENIWGGSPWREAIWDELGVPEDLRKDWADTQDSEKVQVYYWIEAKGRELPMSPQLCYPGPNKVLCPNLEKLDNEIARKILRWNSMENRRGVVTGWMGHPRLGRDGRLPAGSSGIANTHRQRHHTVVNVPQADGKAIFGHEMRSLFIAPPGMVCVGCDASGLENRLAAHYAYPFDGGEYARIILDGDTHAVNAAAYSKAAGREVTRNESKPITYGTLYGCGGKKASRMLDVELEVGQRVIASFWEANPGLKACKTALEEEWKKNDYKFIRGLDGRRIPTRGGHALLNCAFQSSGAIVMDRAWQIAVSKLPEDGGWQRFGYWHDEYQVYAAPDLADFVGQVIAQSIRAAGEFYQLNVPLEGEYKTGPNWAETH